MQRTDSLYPSTASQNVLTNKPTNIFLNSNDSLASLLPLQQLRSADVVIPSTLKNVDGTIDMPKLITEFNKNKLRSTFTTSRLFVPFRSNWYLNPGEVLLGHRNKIPELIPFNKEKYILRDIGVLADSTQIDSKAYQITEPFFGWHGSYVLNVPIGQFAFGTSGNIPRIYDSGPHVIHDPNFKFSNTFINKTELYVKHQNLHMVRVPNGKIAKIWINNLPYILTARAEPYVFNEPIFAIQKNNNDYFFDATQNIIEHGPITIVRVPAGKVAKVWINNKPQLLAAREEPYVFNDPLFKMDQHPFVSTNEPIIQHGTITILRVFPGKIAKIWLKNEPFLLPAQEEAYQFNDPLFSLQKNGDDNFFDNTGYVVSHGSKHIVRVPTGKVAKVWVNNKPQLLEASDKAYEFTDPLFRIEYTNKDPLFDINNNVISHGSKHIVRVPSGMLAKVWVNNEALLLDARSEPYVFEGPLFKIDKNGNDYFFPATSQLIVHGSTKLVMPHTGEVAVTYNAGTLEVLEPHLDGKPIEITSATHEVVGFLDVGVRTLVFPSDETKKLRKAETSGKTNDDEINLEIFTTKDSLRVGVKLLVSFRIKDPLTALKNLKNDEGILKHIENLATVDMGKAIQKCTSQEFLCFNQTKPPRPQSQYATDVQSLATPNKEVIQHFQDEVKDQLSKDLLEFGIELVRLNIETPKIIDNDLAKKMSEQAQQTAATSAQEGVIEGQFRIAKRKAEQEAETKRIAQQQANEAKISQAETELEAARKSAQALTVHAEAEKQAMILKAEGEKKAAILRGEQYNENPKLYDLKTLELQSAVIGNALEKIQVLPQSLFGPNGLYNSTFPLFSMQAPNRLQQAVVPDEHRIENSVSTPKL